MLRALLDAVVRNLTRCSCGAWYNPADPADWQPHKNH